MKTMILLLALVTLGCFGAEDPNDIVDVAAGEFHSAVLKRDGTVYEWGTGVIVSGKMTHCATDPSNMPSPPAEDKCRLATSAFMPDGPDCPGGEHPKIPATPRRVSEIAVPVSCIDAHAHLTAAITKTASGESAVCVWFMRHEKDSWRRVFSSRSCGENCTDVRITPNGVAVLHAGGTVNIYTLKADSDSITWTGNAVVSGVDEMSNGCGSELFYIKSGQVFNFKNESIGLNAKHLSCGKGFYIAYGDGRATVWGHNQYGQLGINEDKQTIEYDQKRTISISGTQVSCGGDYFVTNSGQGAGLNEHHKTNVSEYVGTLGKAAGSKDVYKGAINKVLQPVGCLPACEQIESGAGHNIWMSGGACYTIGNGTRGQLGDGIWQDRDTPVAISIPR